jgi:hypothetical protein
MAPRTRDELIQAATDKAAAGYSALGLNPDGTPLQGAPGAPEGQQLQQTTGEPAPGDGTNPPAAPHDQADKQAAEPGVIDQDKAAQGAPADRGIPAVPANPETPPDVEIEQLQQNYNHLRSYADRTSGENSQLRGEVTQLKTQVADLKSQIQVLLSAQPTGQQGQPQDAAAAMRQDAGGDDTTGDVGSPAQTSTQPGNPSRKKEKLIALAEEFPDIGTAILEYADALEQETQDRIAKIEQTIDGQVKPVVETIIADTKRKAQSDIDAARKEHFAAIEQAVPQWRSMLYSGQVDEQGRQFLNPEFDNWLANHPSGNDYFRLLWPEDPKQGASASMVITILKEFAGSDHGKSTAQTIAEQRQQSAAGDLQGDRHPKPLVPDSTPKGAVERLKAGRPVTQADIQEVMKVCRGDAQKWVELWPLVQKAQQEHRIVVGGAGNPALYT